MDLSSGPPPRPPPRSGDHPAGMRGNAGHGADEQQQSDLSGSAYVLERTEGTPQQRGGYSRTHIRDAEELRARIQQHSRQVAERELSGVTPRRLFVVQGRRPDYLRVLREVLDVDPRFVEAHIRRRSYWPLGPRLGRRWGSDIDMDMDMDTATSFACYEYPEFLVGSGGEPLPPRKSGPSAGSRSPSPDVDVAGELPMRMISADGEVAVFCRASLWSSLKGEVLLLDHPSRSTRPSSHLPPWNFPQARYHRPRSLVSVLPRINRVSAVFGKPNDVSGSTLGGEHAAGSSDNDLDSFDELPSFEALLYETLQSEEPLGIRDRNRCIDIRSLAEDIAIYQWLEFFDALSTDSPRSSRGAEAARALFWQIQSSLERNLSSSEYYDRLSRSSGSSSAASEWESLLARAGRRAELLSRLGPIVSNIQIQPPPQQEDTAAKPSAVNNEIYLGHRRGDYSSSDSEQNRQSLDRVSYMGGVLLPLSIVSSILSMSDPFSPGGSMFFVFWAVSIPLVFIAILIIYADSIRKAEVWIEVASTTGPEKPEAAISTPQLEQAAVALEYGGSVPIGPTEKIGTTFGDEAYSEIPEGPSMMVEKTFKDTGRKKWKREQLGWAGACKTAFRIYKLRKGRPPGYMGNMRHGRTV
ncbi:hypothetical protein AAE478_005590 [Parahypoxylon ruwenzoriense]